MMYEKCVHDMPKIPLPLTLSTSHIKPCKGGIAAPPAIIIISKEEPCDVYFPSPAMDKEKMQGHITEQNNPPLIKEYKAILPEVNNPISIIKAAMLPNNIMVKAGFSLARKKPAINTSTIGQKE